MKLHIRWHWVTILVFLVGRFIRVSSATLRSLFMETWLSRIPLMLKRFMDRVGSGVCCLVLGAKIMRSFFLFGRS